MIICEICKKKKVEFEIDGWKFEEDNIWEYKICKKCYTSVKLYIQELKRNNKQS